MPVVHSARAPVLPHRDQDSRVRSRLEIHHGAVAGTLPQCESLAMALASLQVHRLRSALTMLGIVIGNAAPATASLTLAAAPARRCVLGYVQRGTLVHE